MSRCLGGLACGSCGLPRASAPDKAAWLVLVVGGVLRQVLCPRCERREP
jgi:hypothetical protein